MHGLSRSPSGCSSLDQIGKKIFHKGVAHIFVVRQLDDVDIAGEVIRGLHWHLRGDRSKRWIILSSIGGTVVLAHELGHFFGLPHSRYVESVMNKKPREAPTWEERIFAEPEVTKMLARRDEMLATDFLHRCSVAEAEPEPEPAPVPAPAVDPFVAPAAFAWAPRASADTQRVRRRSWLFAVVAASA